MDPPTVPERTWKGREMTCLYYKLASDTLGSELHSYLFMHQFLTSLDILVDAPLTRFGYRNVMKMSETQLLSKCTKPESRKHSECAGGTAAGTAAETTVGQLPQSQDHEPHVNMCPRTARKG